MKIDMVPHDPQWRQEFQQEAEQITVTLGSAVVTVHHMGSTAIPTVYAKPVIDLLLVVQSVAALDEKQPAMEALGYEALGEFGIPGRRYFRRNNALGDRTHQVHAFETGSPQITRHLAFRDYIIAHPETAQEYSDLKRELAAQYPNDIEAYMDGKDEFIQEIDRRAARLDSG
jgi:GrpB-like predicted nucleotidyltransferase (UPF0157 family)